jgi:hypothetical protein
MGSKKKNCVEKESKLSKIKGQRMKFIEVGDKLYPFNDRIVFEVKRLNNGICDLYLSYEGGADAALRICEVSNHKGRSVNEMVSDVLAGRTFELYI